MIFRCDLAFGAIGLLQMLQFFGMAGCQCPEQIFRYYWNETSETLGGLVKIPHPPQGDFLRLRVTLDVQSLHYVANNYLGGLNLANTLDESTEAVTEGKPLYYKIQFPFQEPIPHVESIILNNNEFCRRGPPNLGIFRQKIFLEHSFGPVPKGQINDYITVEWLNEIKARSKQPKEEEQAPDQDATTAEAESETTSPSSSSEFEAANSTEPNSEITGSTEPAAEDPETTTTTTAVTEEATPDSGAETTPPPPPVESSSPVDDATTVAPDAAPTESYRIYAN